MADVFTKKKRSEVMSKIRSRGNKETEIVLAKLLRQHKLTGWRRHPNVFGRPDFVFRKLKLALFVDGCFWHGCPKHSTLPKNNRAFWRKKFARNRARDRLVNRTLRREGFRRRSEAMAGQGTVLRFWEHELGKEKTLDRINRIYRMKSF